MARGGGVRAADSEDPAWPPQRAPFTPPPPCGRSPSQSSMGRNKEMGAGVATGPHCLGRFSPASRRTRGSARRVSDRRWSRSSAVFRAPRQGARPWRFAAERGPKVPPGDLRIRRLSGNSVRLRIRSAVPEGLGSRRKSPEGAAAPSSRPSLASATTSGETAASARVWLVRLRTLPSDASPAGLLPRLPRCAPPGLSPSCRSRGGFVSRPRLARSVANDLHAPAVAGKASVPFPDRASVATDQM